MKVSIWYSESNVDITLPDRGDIDLFDLPSKRLQPLPSSHWLLTGETPFELRQFLTEAERLVIVVNDAHRPTPTARILGAFRQHIKFVSTRFLVATGLHSPTTSAPQERLFGDLPIAGNLVVHDAYNEDSLCVFGLGKNSIVVNSLFDWCDSILIVGSVEPHYFAGFTGGRKIILPGCASFADVERNHALAVQAGSQPLARQGNPVWEDIQNRTLALDIKKRFSIQVVCDHDGKLFYASHGDWDLSYGQACEFVMANYAHDASEKYDIVISVVYPPLDRNLYQLQKSYENVAASVRDGGTILLVSACLDGVGDDRFLKIAETLTKSDQITGEENESLIMGMHKVRRTIALAKRVDLVLCSKLDNLLLDHLPITARTNVQAAIDEVVAKYGDNCRIAVVLDAGSQVLYHHAA